MRWRDEDHQLYRQEDGDKEDTDSLGCVRGEVEPARPPTAPPVYTEPKIVPYDGGWPEYEEAAVEF